MSQIYEGIPTIIKSRQSTYPAAYIDQPIPHEDIIKVLEAAIWAPTHKMTQPWRFSIVTKENLPALAYHTAEKYSSLTPVEKFSEMTYNKMMSNISKAGAIIGIGMCKDKVAGLPEWEEVAAVAMAVQNMWLQCTALNIGCYWGTSKAALASGDFLGFDSDTQCLGFFYMGYTAPDFPSADRKRKSLEEVCQWK